MVNRNPQIEVKPLEAANYAAIAAAVVTAIGGYKLFEPKLERMRAVRNEMGRLTWGLRLFYQWPQVLLIALTSAIAVDLTAAFFDVLHPGVVTQWGPKGWADALLAPETTIWIIFAVPIIGLGIYWNGLPRLLLWLGWLISGLPVPGLHSLFGRNGESLGWHQTRAIMEGPDKGQPLLIDDQAVDRVAFGVLARLSKDAGMADYAAEPATLSSSAKANILLFGCVLEAIHYGQLWPLPSWGQFYGALADIERTDSLFAPQKLMSFTSGKAFFEVFRMRLEDALKARHQACPPDKSLVAAGDVARAWQLLKDEAKGDLLNLAPPAARFLVGRIAWLHGKLHQFPQLDDDSMRPQLIKLLIRWKALTVAPGVFAQPFSKHQAWLLFQHGALRALPELKDVTFNGTGQVSTARLAALKVIRRTADLIAEGASSEAQGVATALGTDRWTRLERADFALWSWAKEASGQADAAGWNKASWRWKLDGERVQRTS
jgi:hypothetical protein